MGVFERLDLRCAVLPAYFGPCNQGGCGGACGRLRNVVCKGRRAGHCLRGVGTSRRETATLRGQTRRRDDCCSLHQEEPRGFWRPHLHCLRARSSRNARRSMAHTVCGGCMSWRDECFLLHRSPDADSDEVDRLGMPSVVSLFTTCGTFALLTRNIVIIILYYYYSNFSSHPFTSFYKVVVHIYL